ncbi:MAG: adenosylcobinamide-GDP ribazoletransferase [Thermodesulfobacteriota bacterium]
MRAFLLAWQFLTVFPGKKEEREIEPRLWGQSMAFYPLIGLILGLIIWLAYFLLVYLLPRNLADGLLIALLIICNGALHLDGLADTCDGLAFGKTAEERLQIMKDHHIGTFGVLSLIVVLGIKFLSLNALPDWSVMRSLLLALVLSRWSMVQITYRTPYARKEGGLGRSFKDNLRKKDMVFATFFSLFLSFLLFRFWGMLIWLAVGIFTLGLQKVFEKKFNGFTGDTLGATNELNEVIVFILASGLINI